MVLNNLKPGMTLASGWNDDEDESFIALPPFVEAFNKSLQLQKPAATEFKSKQPTPKQVENKSSLLPLLFLLKKIHTVITSEGLQIDFFVSQKAMFAEQNGRRIEEKDILFEDRESYQYLADREFCVCKKKLTLLEKLKNQIKYFFLKER